METNTSRSHVSTIVLILISLILAIGWFLTWRNCANAATPVQCDARNLSLHMGTSDGTAGTIYDHAVITNNGAKKCQLTGYPAAFLLDTHNTVLGSGAASNPLYTPVTVTLAPHGTAHTILGLPDAGNFDPGVCSAVSTTLRLYIPGSVTSLHTSFASANCPGFSVTAIQPGV
ncbi:MAG: DUF4232 domain-containing protein [Candidatus Saccharibacteria bacterium]